MLTLFLLRQPANGSNMWAYVAQYQMDKLKLFMQAMPFGPEKLILGVQGKHGRHLDTYAEFKLDPRDASEAQFGFKTRIGSGEIRGNISTTGRVQSVYRKMIQLFELEMQSQMDLYKPDKNVEFGVSVSMRGM